MRWVCKSNVTILRKFSAVEETNVINRIGVTSLSANFMKQGRIPSMTRRRKRQESFPVGCVPPAFHGTCFDFMALGISSWGKYPPPGRSHAH